jgi:glyoxylase-like metal-dependent hydrolase (beta-lactamase superfamily II)
MFKCCDNKAEIRPFHGKHSNIYFVVYPESETTTLVDCGLPWDIPEVISYIKKEGLPHVNKVVCTHFHVDHCAGWVELKKEFKSAFIYFHKKATSVVSGADRVYAPELHDFTEIMLPVMKEYKNIPTVKQMMSTLQLGTSVKSKFPMDRTVFFDSGEEVIDGFQTIHTPGHTSDSTSFYDPGSGIFISGDFVLNMNGKVKVNTFVYDETKQMESVEKVKKLDNLMYLLPGHGAPRDFNEKMLIYKSERS